MGKANRNKNILMPQMMPTIPVAAIEENKDKNANDVPQANNNRDGAAAKSHKKGKEKRKGKRGAKKSNSDANAKDDKKLKLPNPTKIIFKNHYWFHFKSYFYQQIINSNINVNYTYSIKLL